MELKAETVSFRQQLTAGTLTRQAVESSGAANGLEWAGLWFGTVF